MRLSHITVHGFKSFAKKTTIDVTHQITGVVGPNGSGKSNVAEAIRFVLGEQSMKSMRGKLGSDLIFKGSHTLPAMSRASVTMTIDNREKSINSAHMAHASEGLAPYLVYDELVLSRVIYADGTSDYTLNDAKVRLKDVQELLAFAGIGGSAHTIINQGEADRILLASPKERKEALEDALGLRVYHMRLNESRRKLDKVKTHVHEVELLRKEIVPHLAHLRRQVEKLESKEKERQLLHQLLIAYLNREEKEMSLRVENIQEAGASNSLALITDSIRKELEAFQASNRDTASFGIHEKQTLQAEMRSLLERRDQITKTLGRFEAEKSYLERELAKEETQEDVTIAKGRFIETGEILQEELALLKQSLHTADIQKATDSTEKVSGVISGFFNVRQTEAKDTKENVAREIEAIAQAINEHEEKEKSISAQAAALQEQLDTVQDQAEHALLSRHEEEKKKMLLESKLRELESTIALRRQEETEVEMRKERFDGLLAEGSVIVGHEVLRYKDYTPHETYRELPMHDLMRAIERSKIKIEEAGIPNAAEVISEYKQTVERDEYLTKELADIKEAEGKLLSLIDDLSVQLTVRFVSGVELVSKNFSDFFAEVFDGGKAKLNLVDIIKIDEEGEQVKEQGVDIEVKLPQKKVQELAMFSGGERALTSIALLFAMSSLTPPPFMVLDETDAPLDEHNARKYGQMLGRLAEKSKLLVITHNRETMNHCDMLYGVTIGVEGASKLLSINFKQAEGLVA